MVKLSELIRQSSGETIAVGLFLRFYDWEAHK
jgi:hypothetical protein